MKMTAALRAIGAIVAAIALAIVLLIAVELFGSVVHPFPEGFGGTSEEMCLHVARFPHWVLAAVVPMWGFTAFAGTWVAGRLGNRGSALFIAVLLLAAVIFNISMLPYAAWFEIVMPIVVAGAAVYGYIASAPRKSAATPVGAMEGVVDEAEKS